VKLQYKITLIIFAFMLLVGVPGAIVMLYYQAQSAAHQFEDSAHTIGLALYDSLVHDMKDANRAHVQDAVARIAERPLINEVVIVSTDQVVRASGEAEEIGTQRDDDEIATVLATGEIVTRSEKQYGHDELCVILPVSNGPDCYPCHGAEASILGAIEIGLDRSHLNAQITDQTLIMGLIAGITFVAVGIGLAFMFRSAVVGPLYKLAASARMIAEGDFGARAEVDSKDEIGTVASAFNEMAERVQQYAGDLEDSKRDLEERVEERTMQLQRMATLRGQLLERLSSAQEEERRRVARELHDEAGQALTVIMMDLARAAESLPDEAKEARAKLSQSRSLAAQTLAELRKLINDLRPEVLDQLGLVPALRSYAKSRLENENIDTRLQFRGFNGRLSPQVETTLFRIIQEAMTNIVRHSGASSVNIDVEQSDSSVVAVIADNGNGFDVGAALDSTQSWGLRGMRERVAVVGGQLDIESEEGHGTRIQVTIPLDTLDCPGGART
jgi:signal transduction histidine kinase